MAKTKLFMKISYEIVRRKAQIGFEGAPLEHPGSNSRHAPFRSSVELAVRALISEMQLHIDSVRASVRSTLSEYQEPPAHIDTGIVNAFNQFYEILHKYLDKDSAWRPKPSPKQWLKQEVFRHTAHKYLLIVEARLNGILRDKHILGVSDWEDIKQTIVCRLAASLSEDSRWRPTTWNKLSNYLKALLATGAKIVRANIGMD